MFYILEKDLYYNKYDKIFKILEELKLSYEEVKVLPFVNDISIKTNRKDIFVLGSTKLASICKNMFVPGSLLNDNHNYEVYSKYYLENLLNFDSEVLYLHEQYEWKNQYYFIRPCADDKMFNGGIYDKKDWLKLRKRLLNDNNNIHKKIQYAKPKKILKEYRLFVVGKKIITGSQYMLNGKLLLSPYIDNNVLEFAKKQIALYSISDSFTIDIAETPNGFKIIECGCINCSGFYESDIKKLFLALEDYYNKK